MDIWHDRKRIRSGGGELSLATQKAIERVIERVKKEKISWYRAAKEEGVSLTTVYKAKRALREGKR